MGLFSSSLKVDHETVIAAIRIAEVKTSGEIRVMIARHKVDNAVAAAQAYFNKTGMAKSTHKNGVLIFVAPMSRKFAVIGDSGIHDKCGDAFWTSLTEAMAAFFKRGEFTDGLVHGVERAGQILATAFPRTGRDRPPAEPSVSDVG